MEDLKITIYQVHFINKLDFRKASLCIPPSKCNKLSFMMVWGENTSLMKSHDLCILCCLKDMSSTVKIASPHLKSLDVVIPDLYVPYINADFVFRDTALRTSSLLQAFPSIKNFSQLMCETERRGNRNEDWVAKSFLCYDANTFDTCLLYHILCST